jgi:uncharacterized protein (TIGR03437 family)
VNTAGLTANTYSSTITISYGPGNSVQIPVSLLIASNNRPVINTHGVVTVAAGAEVLTPLGLVSIYGLNFTNNATQSWDGAVLRPTLAGVSISIDGKPAYPLFVSPTFINVEVPDSTTHGFVAVTVTNSNGTSDPVMVQMNPLAPEFKGWAPSPNYVEAQRAGPVPGGPPGIVGPAGVPGLPGAAPAKPGEHISLWALGFGSSNPAIAAGTIGTPAPLTSSVTLSIGGLDTTIEYKGLQGVGLYQLNIVVPSTLADGEYDVVATVGGVPTLKTMRLLVQH